MKINLKISDKSTKYFFCYCICGLVGLTADYFFFYSALAIGIWYQGANLFAYFLGTLISFFLNRKITFDLQDQVARRLFFFLVIAAIGFCLSALMLWLMVDEMSLDPKIAKLLTLPLVVLLQFSLNRRITFDESKNKK